MLVHVVGILISRYTMSSPSFNSLYTEINKYMGHDTRYWYPESEKYFTYLHVFHTPHSDISANMFKVTC